MTKTTVLNDDVHKYLKRVQMTLYDRYDTEMHMPDILSCIIRRYGIKDPDIMAKKIFEKMIDPTDGILTIGQSIVEKKTNIANVPLSQMS